MNITKNPTSSLVKSLMSFKKTYGSLRCDSFKTPLFNSNLGSLSFLRVQHLALEFKNSKLVVYSFDIYLYLIFYLTFPKLYLPGIRS